MKKFFVILLSFAMLFSFSGCGEGKTKNVGGNSEEFVIEHTGKKISGQITSASVFSNGLAFVCLDGNKEKAYCIDKQGNIVFELENKIQSVVGEIYEKFQNGYALIDGGICNTKGEITYPEDVGATEFFGIALKGGYIVATKITADYSTSKQEIGVMNTDFEWIVQPSKTIYNAISEDLCTTSALNTQSFFANGIVYFDGCKKYLNVKTGEVSDSVDMKFPSETWQCYSDNTFRNANEEIMVDLSNFDNIVNTGNLGNYSYKNGKYPVFFCNQQAGKSFWALVDEKGELLFDPVERDNFTELTWNWIEFDGENTVFYNSGRKKLSSFNGKGELLGELDVDSRPRGFVADGTILLINGSMNSAECHYYNPDFSPLF